MKDKENRPQSGMIYRTLGSTGLEVSILGYGTLPVGNEFGLADPREGERAVHLAIERGINYFDVAPCYSRTLPETFRLAVEAACYTGRVMYVG